MKSRDFVRRYLFAAN